jgi:hypothetical protein
MTPERHVTRKFGAGIAACVMVLLGSGQGEQLSEEPRITLRQDSKQTSIDVVGLRAADCKALRHAPLSRERWTAILAIRVGQDAADRGPPMLGSHQVTEGILRFQPRFALKPGLHYRAVFDPSRIPGHGPAAAIHADLVLPQAERGPVTVVEQVYPTSNRLPENQLKFYLHFSAPMSQGEAYRHLSLLNASGKPVDLPFLILDQELWDRSGKRFTLFFDPGRIKRGLKPREEVGPVLEEGRSYTLVIDSHWPDAQGNPLGGSYRKHFECGPPEDRPIDPEEWRLQTPDEGARGALLVRFPRPLDHALLERTLTVKTADGNPVAGAVAITDGEKCWRLTPRQPWHKGAYQLLVDKDLEDLAGNRIGQPFEIDVFRPAPVHPHSAVVPFRIGTDARPQ